jgi:transmembrane E3 ubiquitin-protein ligase
MGACGAIVCGVVLFVGFAALTEFLESASAGDGSDPVNHRSNGGVMFVGKYSLQSTANNQTSFIEGMARLRGLSKSTGAADVAVTTLDIRLEHDTLISEMMVRSGLLMQSKDGLLDFVGRGSTDPFMFPIVARSDPCLVDTASIRFAKSTNGSGMTATGEIESSECKFDIKLDLRQVDLFHMKRKIVHYSIMSNAVSLALIKLFIDQMSLLESNSSFARIAMWTVLMQAVSDSVEAMFNFFTGLSVQFAFNAFIIVSLFRFVLFSFFEMRFLILAWRSINHQTFSELDDDEASRVERNWIQSRLYLPLVAVLLVLVLYPKIATVPLVVLSQLYWVPQIAFDVYKGHKAPLTTKYILGVSFFRLIGPLYMWACPHNIFNGQLIPRPHGNSTFVVATIVAVQVIQVFIMLTQQRYGPRWFVPWACLPHVYNYYRRVDVDEEFGMPECCVCMSELELKGDNAKDIVVTPCTHLFHSNCLQQWIDIGKMECPVCRRELPPIT